MSLKLSRRTFLTQSSVVAAVGLLSACIATPAPAEGETDAASPAAEGKTVRLAVGLTPEVEGILPGILTEFGAAHEGITVETVELPPYVGFFEKIMTQIASNTTPDAALILAYWTAVLGKAEVLLPLDDLLTEAPQDVFESSLLIYCQWNGRTHGLPLNTNVQGLVYNAAQFDQAGIVVPTSADEAWTWDEFMAVCQQLKESTGLDYAYGIYGGAPQGRLIQVYQAGQSIITEDLTASALDTPEAIEAITHIQQLFIDGHVPAEVWTAADPRFAGTEMFKAEQIPMFHGGQWHIPWSKENVTFDWGVTYLQQQEQLITVPGGDAYVVFGATQLAAEATSLIEFLTNEENQALWNLDSYRVPSRLSLLEPGALTYPDHQDKMDLFIDHLRYGSRLMLGEYYAEGWSKTDAMLRQRTSEIATQQMAPEVWAQEVAAEINAYIAEGGF